jgi:hypothetical protein
MALPPLAVKVQGEIIHAILRPIPLHRVERTALPRKHAAAPVQIENTKLSHANR